MKNSKVLAILATAALLFAGAAAEANSLAVNAAAAMGDSVGTACGGSPCGLQVSVTDGDETAAYVETAEPTLEKHYDATFWLQPGGMTMSGTPGLNHFIFGKFYRDAQPQAQHTFIYLKRNNTNTAYRLAVQTRRDDGSFVFCGEFFLGNSPNPPDRKIRVEFQSATAPGSNDGFCRVYRDDVLMTSATGIDNDTYPVDYARFALPPQPDVDTGTSGTFDLDQFVTTR